MSRTIRRTLAVLFLLCLVGGCGSGSSLISTSGFPMGSPYFSLPFLPTGSGESAELVLANYAVEDAPVTVQAFGPNAGALPLGEPLGAPATFTVPANGFLSLAMGLFFGPGAGEGHLWIDTRDVSTLDPVSGEPVHVPTTGYVVPGIEREFAGVVLRGDALQGLVPRADRCHAALLPETTAIQIANLSILPMGGGAVPSAITLTLREFAADGTEIGSFPTMVPPYGAVTFVPPTELGHVTIEPAPGGVPVGVMPRFVLATREEGFAVHAAPQLLDTPEVLDDVHDVGFFVDWGVDPNGNVYDFGLLVSNPTDEPQTATVRAILSDGSTPLLTIPRAALLQPRRTVFFGTTDVTSLGLGLGETSPFSDLFGDALSAQDHRQVMIQVSLPVQVECTARAFDLGFDAFRTIERGSRRTTNAFVLRQPLEFVLGSGRFHDVLLANPLDQPLVVPVRAHTPGGTEYILPSIEVDPLQRGTWTLDGNLFREDPTSQIEPPVEEMKVKFSPLSGAFFASRTRRYNAQGLIVFITPHLVDSAD